MRFSPAAVMRFMEELLSLAVNLDTVPSLFEHPIDPKDSVYVNLAIAAGATIIVTRDRHLLALNKETGHQASLTAGIEVVTPARLLEWVRGG